MRTELRALSTLLEKESDSLAWLETTVSCDAAHFLQARKDVNIHTRTQIPLFHNMNLDASFSTQPKKKALIENTARWIC